MTTLLTRDLFREKVFERNGGNCAFCLDAGVITPAVDAHHIMERRLWPDGGYYLNNGVAVCSACHLACERTQFTTEYARKVANITEVVIPPHLYPDENYDKWGNIILSNGKRIKGELFEDPSVQKVLSDALYLPALFTHVVKYPRTHHLSWSPGLNRDDRVIETTRFLEHKEIVVTIKKDGENTTMYNCGLTPNIHARSVNEYTPHKSRSWVKSFHAMVCQNIPVGWRICGENVYAEHSIHYKDLKTYFYGFSIWNSNNEMLSWDETLEWFDLLGIEPVPVLYRGPWNEGLLKNLWEPVADGNECEGYVVRDTGTIRYCEFRYKVGKFVRYNHIQTNKHWLLGKAVIPNNLKTGLTGFEKLFAS